MPDRSEVMLFALAGIVAIEALYVVWMIEIDKCGQSLICSLATWPFN